MFECIPAVIRKTGRFCCWQYEDRNGRKTKVPYNPVTQEHARSNDPATFSTFENAVQREEYDGIGIGIFDGVSAIDLDHCLIDGQLSETAKEIIELMHSYTEVSPGGDGIHILFRVEDFQYDTGKYCIMNHPAGIEVYVAGTTSKYVTVTGNRFNDFPYSERTAELQTLLDRFMRREPAGENARCEVINHAVNAINAVNSSLTDEELLQKALSAKNQENFRRLWSGDFFGYASQSEAELALCSMLAFWSGGDEAQIDRLFRRSGLMRDKWDRKQSGTTYGAMTVHKAVSCCAEFYRPPAAPEETAPEPVPAEAEPPSTPIPLFRPVVPLKPEYKTLPTFPVDALPKEVREYVQAVAEHSQTSPDMAAVIALGVLAVCLQGKYQVEGNPGYVEPLSLYTVVIASPGERKSSVMRDMTTALSDYEADANAALAPRIRENQRDREAIQRKINALEAQLQHRSNEEMESQLVSLQNELEELEEVKPLRFFADDCSSEALTSLLAGSQGRFAVISTEGGIFDIMNGRYSSKVNIDVWLKGWCGDPIRIDRMGRDAEYIPHPALSAILTIQPGMLDEIITDATMSGRGLIARFLYAFPPSRVGQRVYQTAPIPPEVAAAYRATVFRLMALPAGSEPVTITLTQEACAEISEYFSSHERFLASDGQDIMDWANKHIGTILRIAGLIHVATKEECGTEIQADTIRKAIDIGRYFLAHARYAYSMMGTDLNIQRAQFVLGKLMNKGIQEIKRSELFQMCRGKFFKKTEDLLPTLSLLEDHGYIRQEQPPVFGAGRPADVRIHLNPEIRPAERT